MRKKITEALVEHGYLSPNRPSKTPRKKSEDVPQPIFFNRPQDDQLDTDDTGE